MKKYFVCSDIHGFYNEFISALKEKDFDENDSSHYLIICGDLFDRGSQARELLKWLIDFNKTGRLILIKGNHEDLMEDLLTELEWQPFHVSKHHWTNGTLDTLGQLTNTNKNDLLYGICNFDKLWLDLEEYNTLIWTTRNYYELGDYIFVHGWIPHIRDYNELKDIKEEEWKKAAWSNGMLEWKNGWRLPGKTIVCGHWHTSYGNYNYHHKGSGEFELGSCFEPFIDDGIIALDGCTAFSHKVNVITIDIGE